VSQTTKLMSLYWGCSLGGVAKYASLLESGKHHASVDMRHVCIRGRNWPTDEKTLDLLNAHILWIASRTDLSWVKLLKEEIADYAPDLIMTHGFNGHFAVQVMRILGYYKENVICSYHGEYHPTTRSRRLVAPLFNRFTEWYIQRSLSTVAVADFTKKYLIGKGVAEDIVEVIHNGIGDIRIDSEIRLEIRKEWDVGENTRVIGVASRLDPVKGIECLVSAFSSLTERYDNLILVLLGSGTREATLRKQVENLAISSRVRFAGFRPDVAECLSAFDIFALPSLAEYHSIGLLEAMRAEKPIVATDVGGNTESVRDGCEALIVPPSDAISLEKALGRLLDDEDLAEQLAANARKRFLGTFTEDKMLEATGSWLSSCAERVKQVE